MNYFQLVVDPRGRDLAKRLVTNVVNQQISREQSVSMSCTEQCRSSADCKHSPLLRSRLLATSCKSDVHRTAAEPMSIFTRPWRVCEKQRRSDREWNARRTWSQRSSKSPRGFCWIRCGCSGSSSCPIPSNFMKACPGLSEEKLNEVVSDFCSLGYPAGERCACAVPEGRI